MSNDGMTNVGRWQRWSCSGGDGRGRGGLQRWVPRFRPRLGVEPVGDTPDAFDIIARSVEAMQDRIARYQAAAYRPGLLVEIPVNACGVLDFHCADRLIELGQRRARAALAHPPR